MTWRETSTRSSCESSYDVVLFELITAEENLRMGSMPSCAPDADADGGGAPGDGDTAGSEEACGFLPTLAVPLAPTSDARELAAVHGLCAQLDALDLCRDGWFVADMPRAELVRLQAEAGEEAGPMAMPPAMEAGAYTRPLFSST